MLIKHERQQRGTIDHTPVYPREVVKRALDLGASALILVHNHPSGDPTPSKADIAVTQDIKKAAAPLGVVLHDHLVARPQPPHQPARSRPDLKSQGEPVFTSLSDEQRQFIGTVRELAQGEFRDRAPDYMNGVFPWDNMRALAKLGVLGMAVPEEYGGLGLPVFDTAWVLEEIAKVCYVTAMAVLGEVGVQNQDRLGLHAGTDQTAHPTGHGSRQCPLAISMTEPNAGTDVADYKTNVDRVGDRLRLNGVKTLISRAEEAGMVITRIDGASRRSPRLSSRRKGHAGVFSHRHLSHDGRRKPA